MNSTSPAPVMLLAKWSVTTTAQEKYKHRNSIPYTDSPRCKAEGIAVATERKALKAVAA